MKTVEIVDAIKLAGSEKGMITVSKIQNPYENSDIDEVVSIGVSLGNDEPDWKVHIPLENLDELINILQKVKK